MVAESKTKAYVRKQARREMIAAAGLRIIADKGLEGLRTRDVAAEVGINISTLHFHVPTKAALLELVAEAARDGFLALLPPEPDPGRDARVQLRAEAQAYYDSLCARPELSVCFARLQQAAAGNPVLAEMIGGFAAGWADRFRRIVAYGRDQAVFRANAEPFAAALMVAGALTAFAPRGREGLAQYWPVYDEIERALLAPGVQSSGEM